MTDPGAPAATALLAVVMFAATNVDDLVVLMAFLADPRYRPGEVWAGQYLGIGGLVGASLALSAISLAIDAELLRWLGLVPIGLGLKELFELRKAPHGNLTAVPEREPGAMPSRAFAVAVVTLANGGDNLGVYVPVFATRSAGEVAVMVGVFAVLVAVWLVAARWLVARRALGAAIGRHGHRIVPFVFIAIGLAILL